jgi:hypothetical protein
MTTIAEGCHIMNEESVRSDLPYGSNEHLITGILNNLNDDYWYDVDHNFGRVAHEFFVDTGSYTIPPGPVLRGREAIREFYRWRENRGARVSRHCIVNHRVRVLSADSAICDSIMLLHAADGEPVLPVAPPIQISDVHDVCARGSDGVWRYVSRQLTPLFAGGVPVTIPPANP